jgi:hypothetical protein
MSRLFGCVLVVALGGLALLVRPAVDQETRRATWEWSDVVIDLLSASTRQVIETQHLRFTGTYRQGFRGITLDRLSNTTIVQVGETRRPDQRGVTQPESFHEARRGNTLRINWWFPPITNAARTIELRYRVSGAVIEEVAATALDSTDAPVRSREDDGG